MFVQFVHNLIYCQLFMFLSTPWHLWGHTLTCMVSNTLVHSLALCLVNFGTLPRLRWQTPPQPTQLTVIAHSTCSVASPHLAWNKISSMSTNSPSWRKPQNMVNLKSGRKFKSNPICGLSSRWRHESVSKSRNHSAGPPACLLAGRHLHRRMKCKPTWYLSSFPHSPNF